MWWSAAIPSRGYRWEFWISPSIPIRETCRIQLLSVCTHIQCAAVGYTLSKAKYCMRTSESPPNKPIIIIKETRVIPKKHHPRQKEMCIHWERERPRIKTMKKIAPGKVDEISCSANVLLWYLPPTTMMRLQSRLESERQKNTRNECGRSAKRLQICVPHSVYGRDQRTFRIHSDAIVVAITIQTSHPKPQKA